MVLNLTANNIDNPHPTSSERITTKVVLGRGFSGVTDLYETVNNYDAKKHGPFRLVSIDPEPLEKLGGLAAAGTDIYSYLLRLNVPTESQDPGFLSYLETHKDELKAKYPKLKREFKKGEYFERAIFYHDYLLHVYGKAKKLAEEKGIDFETIQGDVEKARVLEKETTSFHAPLELEYKKVDGSTGKIKADINALHIGNSAPEELPINGEKNRYKPKRVFQNPLKQLAEIEEFIANIAAKGKTEADVVLVGFGNTGVDLTLINNEIGKKYPEVNIRLHVIQQHNDGIAVHQKSKVAAPEEVLKEFKSQKTAAGLWELFKRELKQASIKPGEIINKKGRVAEVLSLLGNGENATRSAQDVGDWLRLAINDAWKNFSDAEKEKWLHGWANEDGSHQKAPNRIYQYWRARVSEEVADDLRPIIEGENFYLYRGGISNIVWNGKGKKISVNIRTEQVAADGSVEHDEVLLDGENVAVLNSTGFGRALDHSKFLRNLKFDQIIDQTPLRGLELLPGSTLVKTNKPGILLVSGTTTQNMHEGPEISGTRERGAYARKAAKDSLELAAKIHDERLHNLKSDLGKEIYAKRGITGITIEQFTLDHLSLNSYFAVDWATRKAVVIDPQRDIEPYLEYAKKHGLTIEASIITHNHADVVPGHFELQEATGARVIFNKNTKLEFEAERMSDGDELNLGNLNLQFVDMPGHTPTHMGILISERQLATDGKEILHPVLFDAGDGLFLGDKGQAPKPGRSDLTANTPEEAISYAHIAYRAIERLRQKNLPADTLLVSAHGKGSPCSTSSIGDQKFSTIGEQLPPDGRLEIPSDEAIAKSITDEPLYYQELIKANRGKRETLLQALERQHKPLDIAEVLEAKQKGATIFHVGKAEEFNQIHIRDAVYLGDPDEGDRIAEFAATLKSIDSEVILVADKKATRSAMIKLLDVGFKNIKGFLKDGTDFSRIDDEALGQGKNVNAQQLKARIDAGEKPFILDIRNRNELIIGAIAGSVNIPTGEVPGALAELPKDRPIVVACAAGFRSQKLASYLNSLGYEAESLSGGSNGWNASYGLVEQAPREKPAFNSRLRNSPGYAQEVAAR